MTRISSHLAIVTLAVFGQAHVVLGSNLVTNGDFEAGNTGFTSGYTFVIANTTDSEYGITTDPNSFFSSFASYGDHTSGSGNMLAVNGASDAGVTVWEQTIQVAPNTDYDFAAYLSSMFPTSPAQLSFSVNSTNIGILSGSSTTGVWDFFFSTWNSGIANSATIEIVNNNTAFTGNDFALDDIYFGAPIFSIPAGDFDNDTDVDGFDFLIWQRGFGTDVGTGNVAPMANGNANGDQFIDATDLAIWEAQYGGPPPLVAAFSTPEPSTLLLACLAGSVLMQRRRPIQVRRRA